MKNISKMMNPAAHEENKAARNNRLSDGLIRFASEQVNTNREYLNINGYVMAVRLPY